MEENIVAACDICGEVFPSRWPNLLIVKMPQWKESEVVNLCPECENLILDILMNGRPLQMPYEKRRRG